MKRVTIVIGKNDKISNAQLWALLVNTIIGVGVLSLPSALAEKAENNGWVILIIASVISLILTMMITYLMTKYRGETLVEIGNKLVSKPVSYIVSILFVLYFIILSAFAVRIFAEVVKMFLLLRTPIEVVIITMLLTTAYVSRGGIEVLGRVSLIIIPIVVIPIFLLILALLPNLDFTNLLPVFRLGFKDILKALPSTVFSFAGFEFLFIYMTFVDDTDKSMRYNILAVLGVLFVYLVTFIVVIAQFGVDETVHQLWPTLSLMITIEVPGGFIENVQGIVMALWVLVVLTALGPAIYGSSLILSNLFKGKEFNYYVLPLVPIIYIISLIPDNLAQSYEYMEIFTYYFGTFASIFIPILYFVVSLLKKKEKGEVTNNE